MQADSRGSTVMPNASVVQELTHEQVDRIGETTNGHATRDKICIVNYFAHDKSNADDSLAPCLFRARSAQSHNGMHRITKVYHDNQRIAGNGSAFSGA